MSTYEKIASVLIGIVLIALIIASYREIKEPEQASLLKGGSDFDASIGQDFKIGPFTTIANQQSSGSVEDNCAQMQPVIVAALHDINEHLETYNLLDLFSGAEETFEVNQQTLALFCNKNAEITLADSKNDTLILQKVPFARVEIPQGTTTDIGTEVRIQATVVPAGSPAPSQPTTEGDITIPDQYLDTTTSTSSTK